MMKSVQPSGSSGSPSQIRQYIAGVVVNLNAASYGYALGWTANALPYLQEADSPVPLTSDEATWVVAMLLLGGFISSPILSLLPNKIGRKMTGYISASFVLAGWILVAFAKNATHLYIARFLCGVNGGGYLVVSPLYLVEIADDNIRGKLGSLTTLIYNGAIAVSYLLGSFLSYDNVIYLGLALPVIFLCTFYWLPETPRHLIRTGRIDEAERSLRWFRGKDHDVCAEVETIKQSIEAIESPQSTSVSTKQLILSKPALKALFIITMLSLSHQLTGITPVLNYTNTIFSEAGDIIPAKYSTTIVGFLQLFGNFLAICLVDRAGRKPLLLLSEFLMSLTLIALGVYFYLTNINVDMSSVGWLPILCLSTYVVSLAIGLGPLIYVVLTEIIPSPILWLGQQLCYGITWFLAFLLSKYFYVLNESMGMYGSFWLFSVCCLLSTIVIIFLLPETKGKSLEFIQEELRGRTKPSKTDATLKI